MKEKNNSQVVNVLNVGRADVGTAKFFIASDDICKEKIGGKYWIDSNTSSKILRGKF